MSSPQTESKYVTSYDVGSKPFQPDVTRGKWSSIWDFYAATFTHSFGIKYFATFPIGILAYGRVFFLIPYIFSMITLAFPLYFIQSFLGQFSSTGFLSVFRVSPVFKGVGYVILTLNLITASYFGVIAAIPLAFLFTSINTNLPWMNCDNSWNTKNCTVDHPDAYKNDSKHTADNYFHFMNNHTWSMDEFLERSFLLTDFEYNEWRLSWRVLLCTLIVWISLGAVLINGVEIFGRILRYMAAVLFVLLLIIFIRLLCLPTVVDAFEHFFTLDLKSIFSLEVWLATPMLVLFAFGSGWGTVLTMASYNNFKDDIGKYSWVICFTQLLILTICAFCVFIVDTYLEKHLKFHLYHYTQHPLHYIFSSYPYLLGKLEVPQLWTIMFCTVLFLGEFSACAVQVFSILTALFDEYEKLRIYKKEITIILIGVLGTCSIVYTFNEGHYILLHLYEITGLNQMIICFCELMMIVWVYGRLRFQRDVQFMLDKIYASWKFWILRFFVPFLVIIMLLLNVATSFSSFLIFDDFYYLPLSMIVILVPLLFIPIYIVFQLATTTGSLCIRFKRLSRPNDWYPVDPVQRERYEDMLGHPDVSHQLVDMNEDNESIQDR